MITKSVKSLLAICFITLQMSSFSTMARELGGLDGGGGVVYKIKEGEYKTLPEFGLLLGEEGKETTGKTYQRYYTISEETKEQVDFILRKIKEVIPENDFSRSNIIGEKGDFIELQNVDLSLYLDIKNEYKEVLKSYGYALDEEKYVLPAFSTEDKYEGKWVRGKTYILPDFNLLPPLQQAKILVHESNMRANKNGLGNVLAVDVQINNFLNNPNAKTMDFKNLNKSLLQFRNARLVANGYSTKLSLIRLQRDLKRPFFTDDLFLNTNVDRHAYRPELTIDSSQVQDFQEKEKLSQNYSEIFEGTKFNVETDVRLDRIGDERDQEAILALCKKSGKEFLNKDLFYIVDSPYGGMYSFRCVKKGFFKYTYDGLMEYNLMGDAPFFSK